MATQLEINNLIVTSGNFASGIYVVNSGGGAFSMPNNSNNIFFNNTVGNVWFIGENNGGGNILAKYQDSSSGPIMRFRKHRGSYASPAIPVSGDSLGSLQFETLAYNGSLVYPATISAALETAPASGQTNIPSQLIFSTANSSSPNNYPSQRMVITSSGYVGINTAVPGSTLDVSGLITSNSGNFTQSLQINGTGVSISGHAHTSSNITDFNSSVSGLLPVTNLIAGSGIMISSSSGSFTVNLDAYSTLRGNGSSTSFTVTHSLGATNDVHVSVRDTGTNYYVYPDIKYVDSNSILIEFVSAPTSNQYRVSIIGF
jgi:hypothetical protein